MFDIGFAEMIIIALLGLVILGPERLPEAARTVFRWVHYLKKTAGDVRNTVEKELNIEQLKQDIHLQDIDKQLQSLKDQAKTAGETLQGAELDLNRDLSLDSQHCQRSKATGQEKKTNDQAA